MLSNHKPPRASGRWPHDALKNEVRKRNLYRLERSEAAFEALVAAGVWEKRPQERTAPIPLSRFGDKKVHTVMMCCRIMAAEYVARDAMDLTDLPQSMLPDDEAAESLDGLVDLEVSDVAFG